MTFTLMPSAVAAAMAETRLVAGILMSTLGRSTSHHSALASAMVFGRRAAMRGSTSIDTRPSTPSVASKTGRSTSQAHRMS